jgi:large subunit ribosomal protein L33
MAKDGPRIKILLRSSAGTGTAYATTKNRRTTTAKLALRKYDPVVRRHVEFRETKA